MWYKKTKNTVGDYVADDATRYDLLALPSVPAERLDEWQSFSSEDAALEHFRLTYAPMPDPEPEPEN